MDHTTNKLKELEQGIFDALKIAYAAATPSVPVAEIADGYWPTLCDRGDGVKGHYCIGRLIRLDEPYWEFWNKGQWVSAGEVFYSKEAAQKALDLIRVVDSLASLSPEASTESNHMEE